MPLYEYIAKDSKHACDFCRAGFEELHAIGASGPQVCPRCGGAVRRLLSAPQVGRSAGDLHGRARRAGFTTYKKLGQGEYEKQY